MIGSVFGVKLRNGMRRGETRGRHSEMVDSLPTKFEFFFHYILRWRRPTRLRILRLPFHLKTLKLLARAQWNITKLASMLHDGKSSSGRERERYRVKRTFCIFIGSPALLCLYNFQQKIVITTKTSCPHRRRRRRRRRRLMGCRREEAEERSINSRDDWEGDKTTTRWIGDNNNNNSFLRQQTLRYRVGNEVNPFLFMCVSLCTCVCVLRRSTAASGTK